MNNVFSGAWHFSNLQTRGRRGENGGSVTDKDSFRYCTSNADFDGVSIAENHISGSLYFCFCGYKFRQIGVVEIVNCNAYQGWDKIIGYSEQTI